MKIPSFEIQDFPISETLRGIHLHIMWVKLPRCGQAAEPLLGSVLGESSHAHIDVREFSDSQVWRRPHM